MFKIIRFKFLKSFSTLLAISLGSLGFSACYGTLPYNPPSLPLVSTSPSASPTSSVSPTPSASPTSSVSPSVSPKP